MSLSQFILTLFEYPIQLLLHYGYHALFVWSVLEGEIGLMLSGWLASLGEVFSYRGVIEIAIAGALTGDILVFSFGRLFRRKAMRWLDKNPERKEEALRWIERWGSWIIVFERFIYGTHIPVLLSLGMSGYRFGKFLLFDIIGVILWAFTFVSIGYYFGQKAVDLVLFFQKNILLVLFLLLIFFLIFLSQKED